MIENVREICKKEGEERGKGRWQRKREEKKEKIERKEGD